MIFGERYCLSGYDFYAGGIFVLYPCANSTPVESNLVDQFDWRNRHGANDPQKRDFYFDMDPDIYMEEECEGEDFSLAEQGNGWMTAVKS